MDKIKKFLRQAGLIASGWLLNEMAEQFHGKVTFSSTLSALCFIGFLWLVHECWEQHKEG